MMKNYSQCYRLAFAASLASLVALAAGCSGSSSSGSSSSGSPSGGGGTAALLPAGSYQGVYVNTSGQYSPDAGTIAFTVSSTGAVSGSSHDYTGDGSTNDLSGNVSSGGALVTNALTGNLSENSTAHIFSTSYTESNGTHGMLRVGSAPTSSALAGSYSGTATNPAHTLTFPLTMTISPIGAITATLGTPAAGNPNSGFIETGYVDTSGNLYLAYTSGGVPSISGGSLALNGTALSGTIQETASDGSSSTGIFSLTKTNSNSAIGAYAGTYTFKSTLTGPSGTSNNTGTFSISPSGVFTILQNSSGYLGSGTATLNSSGQVVVVHGFTGNSDVETDIATISGAPGSYTGSGTYSITTGGTGTLTFTEITTT